MKWDKISAVDYTAIPIKRNGKDRAWGAGLVISIFIYFFFICLFLYFWLDG